MNATHPPPPLTPLPPLFSGIPDSIVLLLLPVVAYWTLSLFFHFLDTNDLLSKYRLHTPAEVLKRNHVTRSEVVRDVVIQQAIQSVVGWLISWNEGIEMTGMEGTEMQTLYGIFLGGERWLLRGLAVLGIDGWKLEEKVLRGLTALGGDRALQAVVQLLRLDSTPINAVGGAAAVGEAIQGGWRLVAVEVLYWYILPVARLWLAIFVLDTWQYFLHRLMHEVKWLYRTFHSRHHRLYVPYAFGALYNHPFEGLLMDTIGAGLGFKVSGMRIRGAMFFFTFSTMKTVDDHCGYSLPWDPLQLCFWNNAGYHDVHHQGWGIKNNFSQPFFICWDRWLGTQWTGNDKSARYAASRQKAAAAVARDRSMSPSSSSSSSSSDSPAKSKLLQQKQDITNTSNGHHSNGSIKLETTNGINGGPAPVYMNGVAGTNGDINGTAKPRIPNGKASASRRQAVDTHGYDILKEEEQEERVVEKQLRRGRSAHRTNTTSITNNGVNGIRR